MRSIFSNSDSLSDCPQSRVEWDGSAMSQQSWMGSFRDGRMHLSGRQLLAAARLRAGLLLGAGLTYGGAAPLLLCSHLDYPTLELLLACLLLRLPVFLLSPSCLPLLPRIHQSFSPCMACLASSLRPFVSADLLPHCPIRFLDAALPSSLLGSSPLCGPDVDLLLAGAPCSPFPDDFDWRTADCSIFLQNQDGLARSSLAQILHPLLIPSLGPSSLICGAFSSLDSLLGITLAVQCIFSGACYSLCESDLFESSCTAAHLATEIPSLGHRASTVQATVLCEASEAASVAALGFRSVTSCVCPCSSDTPLLTTCYDMAEHSIDENLVCPPAAVLMAATQSGPILNFAYTRPVKLESPDEARLSVDWSLETCSVTLKVGDVKRERMAAFQLQHRLGSVDDVSLVPLPKWCSDALEGASSVPSSSFFLELSVSGRTGLHLGPSFLLWEDKVEVTRSMARIRLRRMPTMTVGLLNSIMYAPLVLLPKAEQKLQLMPRRLEAAFVSSDPMDIPIRCFVRRSVARPNSASSSLESFDVVAISSKVKVVVLITGLVLDVVSPPWRCSLYQLVWKHADLPIPAGKRALVYVVGPDCASRTVLLTAVAARRHHVVAVESLGELKALPRSRLAGGVAVIDVSKCSSLGTLLQAIQSQAPEFLGELVLWTNVAHRPKEASFWGLVQCIPRTRVVDFDGSVSNGQLLDALIFGSDSPIIRLPSSLTRFFVPLTVRSKLHGSSNTGSPKKTRKCPRTVAIVSSGGDVSVHLVQALEDLKVETWLIGRAQSGGAKNFVHISRNEDWVSIRSALRQIGPDVVILSPKSLKRVSKSFAATAEAFRDVVSELGYEAVLIYGAACFLDTSGVDFFAIENGELCLTLGMTTILCTHVDSSVMAQVLCHSHADSKTFGYFPSWMLEEASQRRLQRPFLAPSAASKGEDVLSTSDYWHPKEILSSVPQSLPSMQDDLSLIHIVGMGLRLPAWPCGLLLQSDWGLEAVDGLTPIQALLFDATCMALNDAQIQDPPRGSALICSTNSAVDTEVVANAFGFAGNFFPISGCSLTAVTIACALLYASNTARGAVACICAAVSSNQVDGAVCLVLQLGSVSDRKSSRLVQKPSMTAVDLVEGICSKVERQYRIQPTMVGFSAFRCGAPESLAGLVGLVSAIASFRMGFVSWIPKGTGLTMALDGGYNLVVPFEDVRLPPVSYSDVFFVQIIGQFAAHTLNLELNSSLRKEPAAALFETGSFVGVSLVSHSASGLKHLFQTYASWLVEQAFVGTGSVYPQFLFQKQPAFRSVVWGHSVKTLQESSSILLDEVDQEGQKRSPLAASMVWLSFSPSCDGLDAMERVLLKGVGPHRARAEYFASFADPGKCLQLLKCQVLAFDWLCSVANIPTQKYCGVGMGVRNAVACLASNPSIFQDLVMACARDEETQRRLSKRIRAIECFASASVLKEVVPRNLALGMVSTGATSTCVILRRSQLVPQVQEACKKHSIRVVSLSHEASSLLWTPMHRAAPTDTYGLLPAKATLMDIGTGRTYLGRQEVRKRELNEAGQLQELWVRPSSPDSSSGGSFRLPTGSLLIELCPFSERSVSLSVRRASRQVECLSIFGRARTTAAPSALLDFLRQASPLLSLSPRPVGAGNDVISFGQGAPCPIPTVAPKSAQFEKDNLDLAAAQSTGVLHTTLKVPLGCSVVFLVSCWRAVVAHHPVLRTVVVPNEKFAAVYSPRAALLWSGLSESLQVQFSAHVFPRFSLMLDSEANLMKVCLDRIGGMTQVDWAQILLHLKLLLNRSRPQEDLLVCPKVATPDFFAGFSSEPEQRDASAIGGGSVAKWETSRRILAIETPSLEALQKAIGPHRVECRIDACCPLDSQFSDFVVQSLVANVPGHDASCRFCCCCRALSTDFDPRYFNVSLLDQAHARLSAFSETDFVSLHALVWSRALSSKWWKGVARRAVKLSDALSNHLSLQPGERVAVATRDLLDWTVAVIAASRSGLSVVLDDSYVESHVRAVLTDRQHLSKLNQLKLGITSILVEALGLEDGLGVADETDQKQQRERAQAVFCIPFGWSQIALAGAAHRVVANVGVAPSDIVTGLNLVALWVALISGASFSADAKCATVCIALSLGELKGLASAKATRAVLVDSPGKNSAPEEEEEEVTSLFPQCSVVIRSRFAMGTHDDYTLPQ